MNRPSKGTGFDAGPDGLDTDSANAGSQSPNFSVADPSSDEIQMGDVSAVLDQRLSVVVKHLDGDASTPPRRLSVAYAGVVVGVSRTGRLGESAAGGRPPTPRELAAALPGVDIVLVPTGVAPGGPNPGAPWVEVDDIDAELLRLSEAAALSPMAAVTLMQVLRAGTAGSLEHDLLVESLAYSALQAGPEYSKWLAARPPARARETGTGPAVILERDEGQLSITLNRPEVRNAYNVALRDGLSEAFDLVALDQTIETVLLKGSGPAFCSGGDLDEFGTGPGPAASHLIRSERSPALRLARVADRVTAQLHGACVGAGIEIPALAGRVVASPNTRMRLPEVAMGLIPGAGGTASLPRRIGRHRTAWLALSGAWLDAATAKRWGLVDELG
jgi:hypothetical protein